MRNMPNFLESKPRTESIFRSIILFGRNVASYKFALGKSLLELADKEKTSISLEELAVPFSYHLSEHLKINDKQCTSSSSKFLDKIRDYNIGKLSQGNLVATTVSLGFNNVIDAFHVVGKEEVPERFFIDERKERKGIVVTDTLLKLKENIQFTNFSHEVEARWRLVETAWSLQINPQLLEVRFDSVSNELYTEFNDFKRTTITSCRDSLNGYQKGHCFYCHRDIVIDDSAPEYLADVDHFFPHVLAPEIPEVNINGVWNLVLSCRECNRGVGGKFESIPTVELLERLHTRNEYLISSHHPLRETIINQTGKTIKRRIDFLQSMDQRSIDLISSRWYPKELYGTEN